jgi:hypothetical protein
MLTGVSVPRERHREPEYDLAQREPKGAHALVSEILDKVLVANPERRLSNGSALSEAVVQLIRRVDMNAHAVDLSAPQPCTYCGVGLYEVQADPKLWEGNDQAQTQKIHEALSRYGIYNAMQPAWMILRCDHCGHLQTFRPTSGTWNRRRG